MTSCVKKEICGVTSKCLLCCESVVQNEISTRKVERFWKTLKRFTNYPGSKNSFQLETSERTRCCRECSVLMEGFLEEYHLWKRTELMLHWKIEKFLKILRRVETGSQLRSEISRACEFAQSRSIPRVWLSRVRDNLRDLGSESGSSLEHHSNSAEMGVRLEPKWVLSLALVTFLGKGGTATREQQLDRKITNLSLTNDLKQTPISAAKETEVETLDDEGNWEDSPGGDFGDSPDEEELCLNVGDVLGQPEPQVRVKTEQRNVDVDESLNDAFPQETPPEKEKELQTPHFHLKRSPRNKKSKGSTKSPKKTNTAHNPSCKSEQNSKVPSVETKDKVYKLRTARKRTYAETAMDEEAEESPVEHYSDMNEGSSDDEQVTDSSKPKKPKDPKAKGHYKCHFCPKISRTKLARSTHEGITHRKRMNLCPVKKCGKRFLTPEQLQNHQKLHDSFKCHFCPVELSYAPELPIHEMTHVELPEDKSFPFPCSRCKATFKVKSRFIRHFCSDHLGLSTNTNRCPLCGQMLKEYTKKYADERYMINHLTLVHGVEKPEDPPPDNAYHCDLCPAFFRIARHLNIHKMRQHWKNRCPECPAFKPQIQHGNDKLSNLRLHMIRKHPHLLTHLPFICNVGRCRAVFGEKSLFDKHMKQMHPAEGFQCSKCEKNLPSAMKLQEHESHVHTERSFVCPECGKGFKIKHAMLTHMEYHKPPEEWKFQCDTCQKRFADKQKLTQHQRTHTKEKPFVCQICGGAWAHRHNWKGHMIAKHPKEFAEMEDGQGMKKGKKEGNYMKRKGSKKGDYLTAGVRQRQPGKDKSDDEST